jgi:hypothetical protein
MTYRQGELIVASDFNTFRTDVLDIWDVGNGDRGYGQIDTGVASSIPTVAIGEEIKRTEWEAFRDAAQNCSDHQGSTTTFPPTSEFNVGEIVEAHEADDGNAFDINGSLAIITFNRLLFDAGAVSVFSTSATNSRNADWDTQLQHRFTAVFPTVDAARYFFNSGGQIRFEASLTGGSATPQNDSWQEVVDQMGTVYMNHDFTFFGGGVGWSGSSIGYFDLTTAFQQIAIGIDNSGGSYGGYGGNNDLTIEARTLDGPTGPNGDTGRNLEFRIRFTDGSNNPFFDNVDGTMTSSIFYQIATSPLTIQVPIFTNSVVLNDGS